MATLTRREVRLVRKALLSIEINLETFAQDELTLEETRDSISGHVVFLHQLLGVQDLAPLGEEEE